MTIVIAIISYFTILDFPDRAHLKSKLLTKAQCEQVMQRIDEDRADAAREPWNFKKYFAAGADPLIYSYALIF